MNEKPYTGPERRDQPPERWHLKREFQIGHLITSALMIGSALMYVTAVEKRVALLEQAVQQQRDRDERQDRATAEAFSAVNAHLSKIDDKLDRLLMIQKGSR